MIRNCTAILFALCLAAPAAAAGNAEVLVPLQQFAEGMNTANYKLAGSGFVEDASIVDDMAPFHWQGKGSTAQWLAAIESAIQAGGTQGFAMKLGKPRQVQVKGDIAYAAVPTAFRYTINGQVGKGSNITTVVMKKGADGWRITAFAVAGQ